MLHNSTVLLGVLVIVCEPVYYGWAQLVVGPTLLQNHRLHDWCVQLFNFRWVKHTAVRALNGLAVLWLRQLLDGCAYKEDRCWTLWLWWWRLIISILNYCIIPLSCIQPLHCVSVYINCWCACFTSYIGYLLSETIKRCFSFAQRPPLPSPSCLLSPPISLCFHFSSQRVIYCQTHSNSLPQRHTDPPEQILHFYFPHLPIFTSPLLFVFWLQAFVFACSSCGCICSRLSVAIRWCSTALFVIPTFVCSPLFF